MCNALALENPPFHLIRVKKDNVLLCQLKNTTVKDRLDGFDAAIPAEKNSRMIVSENGHDTVVLRNNHPLNQQCRYSSNWRVAFRSNWCSARAIACLVWAIASGGTEMPVMPHRTR